MAQATITTRGEQYINSNRGVLGTLYLIVGKARFDVTKGVVNLSDPVQGGGRPAGVAFPGGAVLALPIIASGLVRNTAGEIVGFQFEAIDSQQGRTYSMSEMGVVAIDGNVGRLIGYAARDASEGPLQIKASNGTLRIRMTFAVTGTAAQTITTTTTVQGLGDASETAKGAVQFTPDSASYTQGIPFVLTPAQVQKLIADIDVDIDYASATEINAGTEKVKVVNPDALEDSRYSQDYVSTQKPTQSEINAMRPGSFWWVRSSSAATPRT